MEYNATILDNVRLMGSNDYQQRVPAAAQAGYHAAVQAIFNGPAQVYEEFTKLLNYVSAPYVEGRTFYNPLRELKKPMGPTAGDHAFGGIERHICAQWFRSHSLTPDKETLLKFEAPEYAEFFYSVNEPRSYEFSWAFDRMARAFSEDGVGFNVLLDETLGAMISSDEYDEMNIMINSISEADQVGNGIYKHTLSAAPTDLSTSQELLRNLRAYAGKFKFPSRLYNMLPVPSFVRDASELCVFTDPDTSSTLDVMALAALFNADRAEIKYRVIEIPSVPIPNCYALLTTSDFIYCRDFMYSLEQPFYNPGNRTLKYYLHHQSYNGFNPYVPAVAFVTA